MGQEKESCRLIKKGEQQFLKVKKRKDQKLYGLIKKGANISLWDHNIISMVEIGIFKITEK